MITQIKPVLDLYTRLCDIPPQWLREIEPKVMRGSFLPCWVWTGRLDVNGYAIMTDPLGKQVGVHRRVAQMFWDFPDEYYVTRTCHIRNCVNPGHLLVTEKHPRWLNQDFG